MRWARSFFMLTRRSRASGTSSLELPSLPGSCPRGHVGNCKSLSKEHVSLVKKMVDGPPPPRGWRPFKKNTVL
ncbi:hypothetical protein J4Q44_G00021310 [Coregonus suidteri]|uniref:Uncharacterized protein n=1 Tax=Coregonus suidteri TaxID=861788 RepID=A0AAN8MGU6_9TELE